MEQSIKILYKYKYNFALHLLHIKIIMNVLNVPSVLGGIAVQTLFMIIDK